MAYDLRPVTLRTQRLAGSATWAVLDHALFSLAGMIASLLLARAMTPHAYGAYAVSFAVYLAVLVLHGAIFAEPMLVLATHRFRDQIGSYLRAVLAMHVVYSLVALGLVSAFAALFLRDAEHRYLQHALIAMALAAPFMTLAQLLRRLCYSLWSPREAAIGAFVYLVVLAGAIAALVKQAALGLGSAYAALGVSSLIASCGWLWRVAVTRDRSAEQSAGKLDLRGVMRAHFGFARYGVATSLLAWIPVNVWYVVLPFVVEGEARLATSGHLRALVNFMQPMMQVNGALTTLLVPTFARALMESRQASPWRFTGMVTALAAVYAPLLAMLGPFLNRWLYRGAYPADALTWLALGLVPACHACFASLRSYCAAKEQLELPLLATIASALGCATIGLALCVWRPLLGASFAMLQGFAVQAAVLAWLVRSRR
jgi:O-antigen/teichoic acid export membrane protein